MGGYDDARCGAYPAQFFNAKNISEDVASLTAVLLWKGDAEEAVFRKFFHGFPGEAFFLVDLGGQRLDFVLGEIAEELPRQSLLFCQFVAHIRSSWLTVKLCTLDQLF